MFYVHENMSDKYEEYVECSGKWESDTDLKATCKKDKVEILEYCKKVSNRWNSKSKSEVKYFLVGDPGILQKFSCP